VVRARLERFGVRLARAGRVADVILEDLAALEPEIGPLAIAAGEADLDVEQLEQVGPQRPVEEDAPDGPEVRAQRLVEVQRLGVGLDRLPVVPEPALLQLADLVQDERLPRLQR